MPSTFRTYALRIAYDGAAFSGFEYQIGRETVQSALEVALGRILGEAIRVQGASRTDAGVHARAQVVSFKVRTEFDPADLSSDLNAALPSSVVVLDAARVSRVFHARWSSKGKTYLYRFTRTPAEVNSTPLGHPKLLHGAVLPVDEARIAEAMALFPGSGTFRGACGRGPIRVRQVRLAEPVFHSDGRIDLWFEGSSFGRYMVRNLAGLAIAVGMDLFPLAAVTSAVQGDRQLRGIRAPAQGLTLWEVHYPPELAPFGASGNAVNGFEGLAASERRS
jgi:tRNA pseudouridine38-40 synthase